MADRQHDTGYGVVEQYTSRHLPRGAISVAAIVVTACLLWVAPGDARAVQFHGTVVDAETREPLAGAAVVVFWRKKPYLAMDGPEYLHKIREVVSDAQGRFSIDGSPGIDWNPATYVKRPPYVIVYAVGHKPLSRRFMVDRGYRRTEDLLEALEKGTTIVLPPITLPADPDVADLASLFLATDPPLERIPNLLRVVNEQRRRLGMPPYPPHRYEPVVFVQDDGDIWRLNAL